MGGLITVSICWSVFFIFLSTDLKSTCLLDVAPWRNGWGGDGRRAGPGLTGDMMLRARAAANSAMGSSSYLLPLTQKDSSRCFALLFTALGPNSRILKKPLSLSLFSVSG